MTDEVAPFGALLAAWRVFHDLGYSRAHLRTPSTRIMEKTGSRG
jgi:hypothetical protein